VQTGARDRLCGFWGEQLWCSQGLATGCVVWLGRAGEQLGCSKGGALGLPTTCGCRWERQHCERAAAVRTALQATALYATAVNGSTALRATALSAIARHWRATLDGEEGASGVRSSPEGRNVEGWALTSRLRSANERDAPSQRQTVAGTLPLSRKALRCMTPYPETRATWSRLSQAVAAERE